METAATCVPGGSSGRAAEGGGALTAGELHVAGPAQQLPVPPPHVRPSIKMDSTDMRSEDDLTVKLVSTFDTIVYISCNPDTLHANLEELCNSHDVKRFAVFDQFPYTDHIECGVLLQRRTAAEPADAAA